MNWLDEAPLPDLGGRRFFTTVLPPRTAWPRPDSGLTSSGWALPVGHLLDGCSKSHFYNLVNAGEIPGHRCGRVKGLWVWEGDVRGYLERLSRN